MQELKFKYVCVKEKIVFSQVFTLEDIENGAAKRWMEMNYTSSGVVHRLRFTGLKDKNEVEIYEGNILEHENGIKYIVVWIEQLAGWYLSIPNTQSGTDILSCAASQVLGEPIMLYKLTIIGNIHDKTPNNE